MRGNAGILKKYNRELAILTVLVLIVVVFSIINPLYLEVDNLIDIVGQSTINGFLAIGVTFAIITGGIDLSVGSIMAVVIVCCGQMSVAGMNPFLVAGLGIAIGYGVGMLNGLMITKMKLQPFIATLGTCSILRGGAYIITGGWPVLSIPKGFRRILELELVNGIRLSVVILFAFAIVCSIILKRTRGGTYIYAIGANEEAAKLSGVNTNRYKILAYAVCGVGAAFAGMVMLARLGTGEPTAGQGYELNAIAAAAIGGTSMAGGKGSILGTFLGAITLSALKVGLVVIGMDTFYQYIATGLIIVVGAYFETVQTSISSFAVRHKRMNSAEKA